MAVIPVNIARISHTLRAFNLLETIRRNQNGLFRVQNELGTGLKLLRPSDDVAQAAAANVADRRLELLQQVERNLRHVNSALTEGESAAQDAVDLLMDVQNIASQAINDITSAEERAALSPIVDSVLESLVGVANRPYLNTYLFGGSYGAGPPFELTAEGVVYHGDDGQQQALVDSDLNEEPFTFSGAEFFSAVSTPMQGTVDLDPALTRQTRISELRGTTGEGVSLGTILVSDGTTEVAIDLSEADTVGDLLDRLNAELPASLTASLDAKGIVISSTLGAPAPITIRDPAGGQTARDLGLTADGLALSVGGADLDPVLTPRTALADLAGGSGLDLTGGITIRNGDRTATLDFADAETVEDILNAINQAGVGVWARIADDGRTLEIRNRISGTDLTIEENGGQLATALGVRSLQAGTRLADLNDGRGVETVEGNDLRFHTADGSVIEVDLDGAETLQDVIDRINAAAGGALVADLTDQGNGLRIIDQTAGGNTFRVEAINASPALSALGLDVDANGDTLVGRDVNPIRTDSAFTALMELRAALATDDRQQLAWAGNRLENALQRMLEVQGRLAAQSRALQARTELAADETVAARVLLSDLRDVDLADAIVRFEQMQVALQANMATADRVMNLSLLDYLR